MKRFRLTQFVVAAAVLIMSLSGCRSSLCTDGGMHVPGVPNLRKVNEKLYIGGQPSPKGFEEIKHLGIRTVVNVRCSENSNERERLEALKLGLRYVAVSIPVFQRPSDEAVTKLLELARDDTACPLYVHCLTGFDRVSVLVAVYRISEEGCDADMAYREMKANGFNVILFDLTDFVYEFERRRLTSSCSHQLGN